MEGERRGGGGEGQGVKLVVWNKDSTKRSKKSQGSISKRFTPSDTDRTFFRVKVPSAQDLKVLIHVHVENRNVLQQRIRCN